MLTILFWGLGVIGLLLLIIIITVLGVNFRVQQLKDEKYSSVEKFSFISWVVSWAIPLVFNVRVEVDGLEKLDEVEHGVIYANHQSNIDIVAMLKAIKRPHGYVAKKELDHIFY